VHDEAVTWPKITKKIFNYRLSRARRVIENAFGILSTRWRIFSRPIVAKVENATRIMQAACVLHNFLQRADNTLSPTERGYCPVGYMGGATIGAGRDMSPHFCGMYPVGGTTQFTLYTCGVLQPAAKVTQFTFGCSTWKSCFLFLYSLLLVIQSRKIGS